MQESFEKFISFVENLYGHKLSIIREVRTNESEYFRDVSCIQCNKRFTADISLSYAVASDDGIFIHCKGKMNNFYYRFVKQGDNSDRELNCNELIIKSIIE